MKTFFHKLGAFFKKVLGSNTWEQTASTTIKLIAPLAQSIVALTAGEAAAPQVQTVVNEVTSDLGLAGVLIGEIQSGSGAGVPAQITNALQSVTGNLTGLLSAGHIKDTTTLGKVTGIVNTIAGEVEAILSEFPATSTATAKA